MPVDSLNRVITRFKGLHQDVQPWQVPDGGAAGGKNWWVKDGRIEGIPGVTTITAPATAEVQAIDWYKPRTGNAYLVCICGGKFYTRGATSWTQRALAGLDTADGVTVSVTTTIVTLTNGLKNQDIISVRIEIGDAFYLESEAANTVNITGFFNAAGPVMLKLASAYGGSGSGKMITIPDVLASTGAVSVKQLGTSLVISDGDRPLLVWDGRVLVREGFPEVKVGGLAACLSWSYGSGGSWYDASKWPYRFQFLFYNEETGEHSTWRESYSSPANPTATCTLVIDASAFSRRYPDDATHLIVFCKRHGVTDDRYTLTTRLAVADSITIASPGDDNGDIMADYAAEGSGLLLENVYRPPGSTLRSNYLSGKYNDEGNMYDAEFRRKPPFPLAVHRGIIMGPVSGELGIVEGSGWAASLSPAGGINEPWAWGYHNWQVNPSDGEDDVYIARAGGRVYFAKENSLYQLDDPSPDPALWGWDKVRVSAGFINAVTEYDGRLWGIVRTRKGTHRMAVFDGKRMIIDPRLGDLTGYDVVASSGSLLIVGGGATTYILDSETHEWYGHSFGTLSAASAAPGDSTYDFYVGKASGAIRGFFAGNAGAFDWQSQGFTFGKPWLRKQFPRVALGLRAKANLSDVQVACKVDGGSWATLETAITLDTSLMHWKAGLHSYEGYMIEFRVQSADTTDRLYLEYIEVDGEPLKTDGY